MTFSVPVTAKCEKCQSILVSPDNVAADTRIVCSHCGEDAGSYSEIESAAANAVAAKIDGIMSGSKNS